ncbi:MAG: 8-amino-7-oxononanoate synthase [Gammaproteobacteria bacterium]|nr:8-amino-7-oxononanoate synthase [Gammaproteobacteria bacterium]
MSGSLEESLKLGLAQRRADNRFRERRVSESPQQPVMRVDGRRLLAFCSDDYLGLANHPRVVEAVISGAKKWGAGSGASPFVNGHTKAHRQLEEEFAQFVAQPRALLFSSGYIANLGMLGALAGQGDEVLQDSGNHASLMDAGLLSGARVHRYRHADPQSLLDELQQTGPGRRLVVTEGVFSVDGDLAPLGQLADICATRAATLVVDDAHGFGVLGDKGRGTCEAQDVQPDLLMCTLSQALGTAGALVAGSETMIEALEQNAPGYACTAALPAALAEGARVALKLLETEAWRRDTVWALAERFKAGARRLQLPLLDSPSPIQPLLAGSSESASRLSDALVKAGILVAVIRPPTVTEGQARLRITVSAAHTTGHIDSLLSALADVWESMPGGDQDTAQWP